MKFLEGVGVLEMTVLHRVPLLVIDAVENPMQFRASLPKSNVGKILRRELRG